MEASACEELMSTEFVSISGGGKEVEVECEASDLIGREEQYNVSSDAILKQPLPRIGNRVVIVQHATIPFGAQGVVTAVCTTSLTLMVLLDVPCVAGVQAGSVKEAEKCKGRMV